jgi:S-formylglutathione hydrolase FrmB
MRLGWAVGMLLGWTVCAQAQVEGERVFELSFFSGALQREMTVSVVAPEVPAEDTAVLFFLHGRGRHHRSLLEVEASRAKLLAAEMWVILPDGEDGWYINSPVQSEARYEDYLTEVIKAAKERFQLRQASELWVIGGWSMGGYGAMRYAQRHAEGFGAVVAVIGLLDFPRESTLPVGQNYAVPVDRFGDAREDWPRFNPLNRVAALSGKDVLLITADGAFDRTMNENFSAALIDEKIAHRWRMLEGGHTFAVVQESLPLVLDFVRSDAN